METRKTRGKLPLAVLFLIIIFSAAVFLGAPGAYGGPPGPNQGMQVINGCMDDIYPGSLNCAAEDVKVAKVTGITISDPCDYPGDLVTFTATYEILLTATARHDIGIYFALDGDPNGDGALTGQCSINTLPYYPNPPYLDLDGTNDPLPGDNRASGLQDYCGDIDTAHNPLYTTITITAVCVDKDGDGKMDLPYCTSWRQPGQNFLCQSPLDAYPGAPSKCKCGTVAVDVPVPPAKIDVTKTADPSTVNEPGGSVTFTVTVDNPSIMPVSIASLSDSVFGNITVVQGDISSTTCVVPQTIAAHGSYRCSFTAFVGGQPGSHTDTVTAAGTDTLGRPISDFDDATVTIADVGSQISIEKTALPSTILEPGANVTFNIVIRNLSLADKVTITSLNDDIYGNLDGKGDCAVGQTLEPSDGVAGGPDTYSCSFTAMVAGNAGEGETDTVTVTGLDDDNNHVTDDDSATVLIENVLPIITVTKQAIPDQLDEPGSPPNVVYQFTIFNTSGFETVTINSLYDDVYGELMGQGTCAATTVIDPGKSYSCAIEAPVNGNAGYSVTNTVQAFGKDDDGYDVSSSVASETVNIVDVKPRISVTKTADPASVPETGGNVTFTVEVKNLSTAEPVLLSALSDDVYGNLNGQGTCAVPQTLAPANVAGDTYTCSFSQMVSGNFPGSQTDVVTATASDDEGNPATATDDATVTFEDVPPQIRITKTADPTSVPETGGDVTFTFLVENIGKEDATLTSLTDSVFGDLNGKGTCATGGLIPVGGSYSCSFTVNLASDSLTPHINVVTATVTDDDGTTATATDDATVTFENVPPTVALDKVASPLELSEPGGAFTFTLTVRNTSAEAVTITSLTDTNALSAGCTALIGTSLPAGGSASCTYTVNHTEAGTYPNTASVTVQDNDASSASAQASAEVKVTNAPPTVDLTKEATPASLPEPGGVFTFTLTIKNTSVETVTITALTDNNPLPAGCTGLIGTTLAAGASTFCTYTVTHTEAGNYPNTASVTVKDNENNTASDSANASVAVINVDPAISVQKDNDANGDGTFSDAEQALYEGASVTFMVTITNNSVEQVTIGSIIDDKHNLNGSGCEALIGSVLMAGQSVSCTFTGLAPADSANPSANWVGLSETDTVTVTASDNEGGASTAADTSTVTTPPRGKVIVSKTVSDGSSPAGFTFQIRTGASTSSVGTILASGQTDAAGSLTFQWLLPSSSLVPGGYQLCEANVLPGWTSSLRNEPGAFMPPDAVGAFFVPNAINPLVDNSSYCVPFTLDAGQELTFTVVNAPPPGGDGRTIGYWKNWSSCTGGGQDPVLDETLAGSPLTDISGNHGVWIGKLFVNSCQEAVYILNKSSLDGKKRASDAAYELASQLLAAKLNVLAGARNCTELQTLMKNAQALLVSVSFNGTASYLASTVKDPAKIAMRNQALNYAKLLDNYNNNRGACMP